MEPFEIVEGQVALLDRADVDTDQIIPKQFLKRSSAPASASSSSTTGSARARSSWSRTRSLSPGGTSARDRRASTPSGRSRTTASAWSSPPSFSDIFYSNCTKNGLLPVILDEEQCRKVAGSGEARVDLDDQTVNCAEGVFQFEIDEQIKHRLMNGLDDVAMTLQRAEKIDEFEGAGKAEHGPVTTSL